MEAWRRGEKKRGAVVGYEAVHTLMYDNDCIIPAFSRNLFYR